MTELARHEKCLNRMLTLQWRVKSNEKNKPWKKITIKITCTYCDFIIHLFSPLRIKDLIATNKEGNSPMCSLWKQVDVLGKIDKGQNILENSARYYH